MLDVDHEIEQAIGKILGGEQPADVLRELAAKLRSCPRCGEDDVCFACKAQDLLGEQGAEVGRIAILKAGDFLRKKLRRGE